jgi:hypothetical protein
MGASPELSLNLAYRIDGSNSSSLSIACRRFSIVHVLKQHQQQQQQQQQLCLSIKERT